MISRTRFGENPASRLVPLFLVAALSPLLRAEDPAPAPATDDASLTIEEYMAAGMPAPDRTWQATECEAAAAVLTKLYKDRPTSLPRRSSKKSGDLFRRLFARENGDLSEKHEIALDLRVANSEKCTSAVVKILMPYIQELCAGKPLDAEAVDALGALLYHSARNVALVHEHLPTLDPKDPTYEKRMAGLKRMGNGLAQTASGCVTTLTERDVYSNESLVRFCGFLKDTLPILVPEMPELSRKEILRNLEELAKAEQDPELKKALEAVVASLKK